MKLGKTLGRPVVLLAALAAVAGCGGGRNQDEEAQARRFLAVLGGDPIVQALLELKDERLEEGGIAASDGRYFFSPDKFRLLTVIVSPQANRFEFPNGPAIPCEPPKRPALRYSVEIAEARTLPEHVRPEFASTTASEIVITAVPVEGIGGAPIQPAAWRSSPALPGSPVVVQTAAFAPPQPGTAAACTDVGFSVREFERAMLINFGPGLDGDPCTSDTNCSQGLSCKEEGEKKMCRPIPGLIIWN